MEVKRMRKEEEGREWEEEVKRKEDRKRGG